jgi:methionine sulfoxide reductase heme-binding subunit
MPFLREKNGRPSPEKVIAFIGALLPALWLVGRVWIDDLGPRPVTEAIHFVGEWAVRFLLLSLAITPARRLFGYGKLLQARRTLGVAAACYAAFHLLLYTADQKFKLGVVVSEIVLRFYLTIGFIALVGLLTLAATSTDACVRRLGPRWTTLHRVSYVIATLAILHFMLQKKLEIYEPTLMAGLTLWLFGYRLVYRLMGRVALPELIGSAVASGLLTALLEAGWFAVKTGVDPRRVLEANLILDFDLDMLRPAWWVLTITLGVAVLHVAVTAFQQRGSSIIRGRPTAARARLAGDQAR